MAGRTVIVVVGCTITAAAADDEDDDDDDDEEEEDTCGCCAYGIADGGSGGIVFMAGRTFTISPLRPVDLGCRPFCGNACRLLTSLPARHPRLVFFFLFLLFC